MHEAMCLRLPNQKRRRQGFAAELLQRKKSRQDFLVHLLFQIDIFYSHCAHTYRYLRECCLCTEILMLLECFGPLIQPVVSILKGAPKPSQTTTIKDLIFPPWIFVG